MAGDHKYYYDFSKEIKLDGWQTVSFTGGVLTLSLTLRGYVGDYVLLSPDDADVFPQLKSLTVNGREYYVSAIDAVYVEHEYSRHGIELTLTEGENIITAVMSVKDGISPSSIDFRLIEAEPLPSAPVVARGIYPYAPCDYRSDGKVLDTEGFSEGIGHSVSVGRFGFSKGDGLLDCAMPALGIVDKMFLCGQPRYTRPYRWCYSLLPSDMPLHGSFEPRDVGIDNDNIKINHLSVNWSSGDFSATYSLGSPAILTERADSRMHLGLRYAGNYTSVLIPREGGVEYSPLDTADISGMAENWIILHGCTEFPDVPIMLVFDRNPESMTVSRDPKGRLLSVDFCGTPLMLSLTPFGIERFEPGAMPVDGAIRRASLWSRAVLAYPVAHKEYFKIDNKSSTVTVRQQFEYRYIADQWGTEPLELSPLPPPLSISGVCDLGDSLDFEFPTKYGYLYGRVGSISEYTVPMMPTERRFPMRTEGSPLPSLLADGMKEYIDFSSSFDTDIMSYPYAGAHLESFALPSTLSLLMPHDERGYLTAKLRERMRVALDSEHISDYVVLNWGDMMAENPGTTRVKEIYAEKNRRRMQLASWNSRTEPFTGAEFNICYLNVSYISSGAIKSGSKEEIKGLKIPLIENDWGLGLTFYYLYLSALATGSFDEIKNSWELLKSAYSFFILMQDFACMGTGYSDNAITWVEGANYGAFTSFIRMAEAVGDAKFRDLGIYNAAKQLTLRLAIIRSAVEYFPKFFGTAPWYTAKHFHEEFAPSKAFQNYPNLYFGDFRRDAVYNFTTEGLYPEAYTGLRKYGADVYSTVMDKLRSALVLGLANPNFHWGIIEQYTAMLIDKALDPSTDPEDFSSLIKLGLERELIVGEWRGIHIFSRALPKNYFLTQLLFWMESRSHKAWLTHWENLKVDDAVCTPDTARITFSHSGGDMRIVLGLSEAPKLVTINGTAISTDNISFSDGVAYLDLRPQCDGILELFFGE